MKVPRIRSDGGITTTGDHQVCGVCHKPRLRPLSPQGGWQDITIGPASPHTLPVSGGARGQHASVTLGSELPPGFCSSWPCDFGGKWPNCAQPQFPHLENGNNRTSSIGSQQGLQERRISVSGAIQANLRGSINDSYFF